MTSRRELDRDDLLAQQRAAEALDEVAGGAHLVGAVDGEVDPWVGRQVGERDAYLARQVAGGVGRRDAGDAGEPARRQPPPDLAHRGAGRGAGAQAQRPFRRERGPPPVARRRGARQSAGAPSFTAVASGRRRAR